MNNILKVSVKDIPEVVEAMEKASKEIERLKEENKKYNKWIESLNKDNHRLNNIIKEVREYIEEHLAEDDNGCGCWWYAFEDYVNAKKELLEILDKGE